MITDILMWAVVFVNIFFSGYPFKMNQQAEFETVYRKHHQRLYTFAFRMTGNSEDAEDVLQTAFVNAYRAYQQFRHG